MKLTQKQESFAFNIAIKGLTQREAWIQAGYSSNYALSIVDIRACELAAKGKIKVRIAELVAEHRKPDVADYDERQRILTELARGNLLDYQEVGADGGYLSIGKESPNTRAISEITSRTEYDEDGVNAAVITKVKLHSPTQAIDLLNKMDKIYSDVSLGYQDNRVVNYYVIDGETKDLITQVKERTRKLIEES